MLQTIPSFLKLLFFVEMWERFSYYGLRALLVLYLTSSLGFADPKAYAIYALFTALGYAGPVLGGFLADRYLGFRKMVMLGGFVIIAGHLLLSLSFINILLLYLGMAFIAVGTGLFKGNITSLLGLCYEKGDPERERGFTLFYVGINLGSFLASICCGLAAQRLGWHYGFGLAAIGMGAGLIAFIKFQHLLGRHGLHPSQGHAQKTLKLPTSQIIGLGAVLAAGLISLMLQSAEKFSTLLSFVGQATLAILGLTLYRSKPKDRRSLSILFILIFFLTCFFALELQLGSLITLFTSRNVDRTLFGFNLPASFSQSINPFFIIATGPLLSSIFFKFMNHTRVMLRFSIGLSMMTLCFFTLYLASSLAADAKGLIPLGYLVLAIALMALGELCVAPLVQAACTVLAPERLRGFLMGIVTLALSYASLIGYWIAKLMAVPQSKNGVEDPFVSLTIYNRGFFKIMLANLAILALFLAIQRVLQRSYLLAIEETK